MIDVHLIRCFEGPRHTRLERIWGILGEVYKDRATVWIHDNLELAPHAEMLKKIWTFACEKDQDQVLVTEFDFLPDPAWLDSWAPGIEAAEYCTRNEYTRRIVQHGRAGPWWLRLHVQRGVDRAKLENSFRASGPFTDPCGELVQEARRNGIGVRLLAGVDDYPRSYGVNYPGRGLHLFWSRHYHDDPYMVVGGVLLGEMQRKVDKVVAEYEETFEKCHRLA